MLSIRGTAWCVLSTLIALKPVVAIQTAGPIIPSSLLKPLVQIGMDDEGVYFNSGAEGLATVTDEILARIHEGGTDNDDWTFVDLGCGHGAVVQAIAKTQRFQHIVGVELDQDVCQEAQRRVDNKTSDIVCSDFFEFVHKVYSSLDFRKQSFDAIVKTHQGPDSPWNPNVPGELAGRKTVYYMFEPLWATDFTREELHQKYCGMLGDMAANAQREIFVVYASTPKWLRWPQADPECFKDNGFVLRSEIFADLSGWRRHLPEGSKGLIPSEYTDNVQVWHLDPVG